MDSKIACTLKVLIGLRFLGIFPQLKGESQIVGNKARHSTPLLQSWRTKATATPLQASVALAYAVKPPGWLHVAVFVSSSPTRPKRTYVTERFVVTAGRYHFALELGGIPIEQKFLQAINFTHILIALIISN
jgi:hypothetical protein